MELENNFNLEQFNSEVLREYDIRGIVNKDLTANTAYSIGRTFGHIVCSNFSEKRISKDVKKTISSAVANAENNYQYDIDKLIVKEAYCGKKIVMKRFRPRAKGRASPIKKPFSRITIVLEEKKEKKVSK